MITFTCNNCGKTVTKPRGDEGRGKFCTIRCARAQQPSPPRSAAFYEGLPARRVLRFWAKVERSDGCWIWLGAKSSNMGHGLLTSQSHGKKQVEFAHRVSWELNVGPIPEGANVLHRCDNPPCVRPDHLFLGTRADNNADRDSKGRHRPLRGASNPRATITEGDVLTLRRLHAEGVSIAEAARQVGASYPTAYLAVQRRSWRHVP